jgi:hypothetical protein
MGRFVESGSFPEEAVNASGRKIESSARHFTRADAKVVEVRIDDWLARHGMKLGL